MNGNLPQAVVGQQSFIISIMKCLFVKKKYNSASLRMLPSSEQTISAPYLCQAPRVALTKLCCLEGAQILDSVVILIRYVSPARMT